jgi:hypothetical protein
MHFLFLADLIGLGSMDVRLNELTSKHFSLTASTLWKRIGVKETQDLIRRYYMGEIKS